MSKLQTLKRRNELLSNKREQLKVLSGLSIDHFESTLNKHGVSSLKTNELEILQINLGYLCDLTCAHCHVDAGPDRKEIMTRSILEDCLRVIDHSSIHTVDLTGGAPEMNPYFQWFIEELSKRNIKTIVRSNLTILVSNSIFRKFPEFMAKHKVEIIASLPCYTAENVNKQRGNKVFERSVEALKVLNDLGYGQEESDLNLHLVYNPGGASLPPLQESLENDYKRILKEEFNLVFNHLYTITNLPVSRFLDDLIHQNKLDTYMELLVNSFNLNAVEGLMCKNTVSVDWEGNLYDCDFNQMLGLQSKKIDHISNLKVEDFSNREIMLNNHCYGCTAGYGSSCQGALV